MHYGIVIPNFGCYFHPRAVAALAVEAEDAGWDGLFSWDHTLFGPAPVGDPWISLAASAMVTERIKLGTLVTPIPRRRPTALSRQTVALDHLSSGRLILGVGTGTGPWEWDWLGEEMDPKTRGEMLDEGLDLLTGLWSSRPLCYKGKYYTVCSPEGDEQLAFLPPPVQSPRIPIWVGGIWPNKRPFKRAAKWDGVVPMRSGLGLGEMMSPEDLKEIVRYVEGKRTLDEPLDVAIAGHTTGIEPSKDSDLVAEYADAGATWWLEAIDPWSFGWRWEGNWPEEAMEDRIKNGPPRI